MGLKDGPTSFERGLIIQPERRLYNPDTERDSLVPENYTPVRMMRGHQIALDGDASVVPHGVYLVSDKRRIRIIPHSGLTKEQRRRNSNY